MNDSFIDRFSPGWRATPDPTPDDFTVRQEEAKATWRSHQVKAVAAAKGTGVAVHTLRRWVKDQLILKPEDLERIEQWLEHL